MPGFRREQRSDEQRRAEATYLDSVYQRYGSDSPQYNKAERRVDSGSFWNGYQKKNNNKTVKRTLAHQPTRKRKSSGNKGK